MHVLSALYAESKLWAGKSDEENFVSFIASDSFHARESDILACMKYASIGNRSLDRIVPLVRFPLVSAHEIEAMPAHPKPKIQELLSTRVKVDSAEFATAPRSRLLSDFLAGHKFGNDDLIVDKALALESGTHRFRDVEVKRGAVLQCKGNVLVILAKRIRIEGTIDLTGKGYRGGVSKSAQGQQGCSASGEPQYLQEANSGGGAGAELSQSSVGGGGGGFGSAGSDGVSICGGKGGRVYGTAAFRYLSRTRIRFRNCTNQW